MHRSARASDIVDKHPEFLVGIQQWVDRDLDRGGPGCEITGTATANA
jgi:hypothetical protein